MVTEGFCFNWPYFLVHLLIATSLLLFVIAWSCWLWILICRPARWQAFVKKEHAVMRAMGLPDWAARIMYAWQVGWKMKAIMALAILMAFCALHLL